VRAYATVSFLYSDAKGIEAKRMLSEISLVKGRMDEAVGKGRRLKSKWKGSPFDPFQKSQN